MKMRIVCPGILGPAGLTLGPMPETPSLDLLLARGHPVQALARDPLEALGESFALERGVEPGSHADSRSGSHPGSQPGRDLPSAALCLLAQAPELAAQGYWLHADPVHLRADRDRLLLHGGPSLDLTEDESQALLSAFNAHFAEDGLELTATGPGRWYLRAPPGLDLRTWPLHRVHGQGVDPFLPGGGDARAWVRWQNEAQMLFFQHPVNRAREAAGRPTVGGVWTWGGGVLPQVRGGPRLTIADHPLARALARAAGGRVLGLDALAGGAAAWLGDGERRAPPGETGDSALIFWDSAWWPALDGDRDAWGDALVALEALVGRLLADLRAGRIGSLSIDDGAGLALTVSRGALRRFWRRRGGLRARIERAQRPERALAG